MIQYSIRVLNTNRYQMNLLHESRKATVEAISKQLKYVTIYESHSNANYDYFLNLKWFYSLVSFSSLVL